MIRAPGRFVANAHALREAPLASPPPPSPAGEWLLASAFRALCYVMEAAAQFCGILTGDDPRRIAPALPASPLPELQALFLSGLPLCEIAAAERERIWRAEAAPLPLKEE